MRSIHSGRTRAGLWLLAACVLSACTINPVTGERQVTLITAADEISIGESQYAPSRQMQGGDYTLDPALTSYVRSVGNRLAAVSDRALPYEFDIVDSSIPNAWALPGGKIAINRGLLVELHSEAELAAVLGHEIVHAAARHGAQAMQRGLLLQGALIATSVAVRRNDRSDLVVGAASVGAELISQRNSRANELEADEYGMRYMSRAGYDPTAAVTLQETFVRLSQDRSQSGWLAGLFASHPPSTERVERNRSTRAELPAGGEMGQSRYVEATAVLREAMPAYSAYDDARDAFADMRLADARRLASRAVALYPAEAQFHALLGDIALADGRAADAERNFRDALSRNNAYFYNHLQLGLILLDKGELPAAETELTASLDLLPTADAHVGLGQIEERRGNVALALEHYETAASSSSPAAKAAEDGIVRLTLPDEPSRYLTLRTGRDAEGKLLVEIANPTRQTIASVTLAIRYLDAQGAATTETRTLTDPLAPNQSRVLDTSIGPFPSTTSYEVTLQSATLASP